MPVPDFQALMLPLLRVAAEGQERSFTSAVEQLAQEFRLTDVDRADALKSGQNRFYNCVGWARTYLVKAGLLRAVRPGWFQATDRGRELLLNPPPQMDIGYLRSHFPEISLSATHGQTTRALRSSTGRMASGTSAQALRKGSQRSSSLLFRMRVSGARRWMYSVGRLRQPMKTVAMAGMSEKRSMVAAHGRSIAHL